MHGHQSSVRQRESAIIKCMGINQAYVRGRALSSSVRRGLPLLSLASSPHLRLPEPLPRIARAANLRHASHLPADVLRRDLVEPRRAGNRVHLARAAAKQAAGGDAGGDSQSRGHRHRVRRQTADELAPVLVRRGAPLPEPPAGPPACGCATLDMLEKVALAGVGAERFADAHTINRLC